MRVFSRRTRSAPQRGNALRYDLLLLLTAAIWGGGFVAQRVGMDAMEPFTFNAIRFALGAASLAPIVVVARKLSWRGGMPPGDFPLRSTLLGGILAGLVLFAGAAFQQWGLVYTTAGKAAFITGLYVVIVQIFAFLVGQRPPAQAALGAILALFGLYFLSVREDFTVSLGDGLEMVGAIFWACHVLVIGRLSPKVDALMLSLIQFAVCAALNALFAVATEQIAAESIAKAAVPILYGGLMSVGVAFTLQVFSQKKAHPGHAAVILSSEAAFGALYGWAFLGEILSPKGLAGCGLMLAGVIVSQIPRLMSDSSRLQPARIGVERPGSFR
jgi:drug/metabolite transporter (DMT)-like permease